MVYRPTVRYHEYFRKYVDDLFSLTSLDRSQIIRAALFTAAYSNDFKNLMKQYLKNEEAVIPFPSWKRTEKKYWLEMNPETYGEISTADVEKVLEQEKAVARIQKTAEGGRDVPTPAVDTKGTSKKIEVKNKGGIVLSLG
ncbi:hypothetical protein BC6307_17845 [Sutcliffiella cohnii]|uniref:Uncharacterized protein n=1 Tax=Sutcliffiella cohnii TaxID=33932 RepID=A0A223KU37_9BACI|nr:hypothetical protein [Sutcliffiella cohnii]AST92990.1 hypothetical protein BC6307_17845 [Sutcliffiella cohnii]